MKDIGWAQLNETAQGESEMKPGLITVDEVRRERFKKVWREGYRPRSGHGAKVHRTLGLRDFLQAAPERIFETDAGLVSINDNGAFDDCGFHGSPFDQRQFS